MSKKKRNIAVLLTDFGNAELANPLRLWLKQSDMFGSYVYCKSVEPNGPYFHMVIEVQHSETETVDFEIQVQHSYVKAVICAADFKKLGFTAEA